MWKKNLNQEKVNHVEEKSLVIAYHNTCTVRILITRLSITEVDGKHSSACGSILHHIILHEVFSIEEVIDSYRNSSKRVRNPGS